MSKEPPNMRVLRTRRPLAPYALDGLLQETQSAMNRVLLPTAARILIVTTALLAVNGCDRRNSESLQAGSARGAERRTLASGKSVVVTGVNFVPSGPALSLSYETNYRMDETDKLEREVDDVWTSFQREAEKAGVQMAIISAENFHTRQGQGFVYLRGADGRWKKSSGFLSPIPTAKTPG